MSMAHTQYYSYGSTVLDGIVYGLHIGCYILALYIEQACDTITVTDLTR